MVLAVATTALALKTDRGRNRTGPPVDWVSWGSIKCPWICKLALCVEVPEWLTGAVSKTAVRGY